MNPTISITLSVNSNSGIRESSNLTDRIQAATAGALAAYFKLGGAREWLRSVALIFQLAKDGRVPVALQVTISIQDPADGQWGGEKEFCLAQFSTKDPEFLQELVKKSICNNFREMLVTRVRNSGAVLQKLPT